MSDDTPPGPASPPPAPCDLDPGQLDLAVGGQAVIEGVMMRTPHAIATAVRTPAGRIVVRKRPFRSVVRRVPLLRLPVLRGGAHLLESIGIGMGALMFAADQSMAEEQVAPQGQRWGQTLAMWGTVVLAFALSLLIFFYLPLLLTDWMGVEHDIWFNVVDGLLRVAFFVAYLWGIAKLPDMARVFQYHGAEHKSIHAFEGRRELSPAGARPFTTLHPRCGTSFLFFVMLISLAVFAFLGKPDTVGERLERLAFVPVIGGLAFEMIKLSGRFQRAPWLRPFIWPGLMLQKITTQEPDDGQLEVGLAALRAALAPEPAGFVERVWFWDEAPAGAAAAGAAATAPAAAPAAVSGGAPGGA